MNISQALNLLNLDAENLDQKVIKKAYKVASLKYHPDKNPAGGEMMKAINAAYDFLKNLGDNIQVENDFQAYDYAEELNEILNQLLELSGIIIEVCGNWIWITGDTRPHSARLGRKEGGIGCFYASKKKSWYYRPAEYKSSGRKGLDMDTIRAKHGSVKVKSANVKPRIAA